jgi:hypothetical protein
MSKLHELLEKLFYWDDNKWENKYWSYIEEQDTILEINEMLEFADMVGYQRHKRLMGHIKND